MLISSLTPLTAFSAKVGTEVFPPINSHFYYSPISPQEENNTDQQHDDLLEESTLYFSMMYNDKNNSWAPFQLASVLASQGKWAMAEYYLRLSSNRGFWYYYNLLEEQVFYPIHRTKVYQRILAETKARYLKKAAGHEAKPFFIIPPQTPPPPSGWPVIVFLHDFANSAQVVPEKTFFYQNMGYAYIELNGTQMLSENSYRWSSSVRHTQYAVHTALQQLSTKTVINSQKIYLIGQGQGAFHAAKLLAKDDHRYAGGLLISPNGKIQTITHSHAKGKRIYLVSNEKQEKTTQNNVQYLSNLFAKNNQVNSSHYSSNTHNITEFLQRYTYPILWMTGREKTYSLYTYLSKKHQGNPK